jgi:hypothetical protein
MTCVPALSQQFTNILFGSVYDASRPDPQGPCVGSKCFALSYGVTAGFCGIGFILVSFLVSGADPGLDKSQYAEVESEDQGDQVQV